MTDRHERAAEAKHRVEAKLGQVWWAILLRGILALALAVCAFVWPEKTLGIFIMILGAYFLIDGVIGVVSAYRSGEKSVAAIQAVISLVLGLILLFWPGISGRVFLILVGIWLILQGFSLLLSAFRMESTDEQRGLVMVIGIVMAVIGAVFAFWTETGVVTISWLIGLGATAIGALLIYLAMRVKSLKDRVHNLGSAA